MSNATAPERPIILLDTSTAIALVLRDHEDHAAAVAAVRGRTLGLAGHAWFETYSVLTRLPSGRRRSQEDALRVLRHDFPETRFLDANGSAALVDDLRTHRIGGGAVFDALVGACARAHDLPLMSGDIRALATYRALGVRVELLPRVSRPA